MDNNAMQAAIDGFHDVYDGADYKSLDSAIQNAVEAFLAADDTNDDKARLEWLLHFIPGHVLRDMLPKWDGYTANLMAAIDAAREVKP